MSTAAGDPTFSKAARTAAVEWKMTTTSLPDEARSPGPYGRYKALPFCLPVAYADHNLLPDARSIALERFAAAQIPWHAGRPGRPSTHLLSSQVQCANALAPLVQEPTELAALFGHSLSIDKVLPFAAEPNLTAAVSPYDATDHVVFEWQGLANHLNEWAGMPTRGSQATSADAAIRYRTRSGDIELALIEWKYTEQYPSGTPHGSPSSQATRIKRYQSLYDADDCPIMSTVAITELFAEPVYQLFRLGLLAHAIERAGELDATRVRVVYVAPSANHALWAAPGSPAFTAHAAHHDGHLASAWSALLRVPDRFIVVDSARLVAPDVPTSSEFKARYGHLAIS